MRNTVSTVSLIVFAVLPLGAQPGATVNVASPPFREFRVEAAHSTVGFSINFLGHPVHGRFDDVRGTIVYFGADPSASSATVAIATSSINTGSKHRDEHLRSSDFFDVATYPTILFTSRIVRREESGFVVVGPLTIHGVTREVAIPFREVGAPTADPHGSTLLYFSGALRIARRDFGIMGGSRYNDWFDELRQRALADSVDITLDVQGWDTDYERSPRWSSAVDRLIADGVPKRVAALRALAAAHPDTLRDAEWEVDQLARALLRRGRGLDAIEMFRLGADLFPKSASAQAALARGCEASGDLARASTFVDRALAIDPAETQAIEIRRRLKASTGSGSRKPQ
jgi:polyisoprenoid-binding protein YceI